MDSISHVVQALCGGLILSSFTHVQGILYSLKFSRGKYFTFGQILLSKTKFYA